MTVVLLVTVYCSLKDMLYKKTLVVTENWPLATHCAKSLIKFAQHQGTVGVVCL